MSAVVIGSFGPRLKRKLNSPESCHTVSRMTNWLTVRTFLAFFLALAGLGLMLVRPPDPVVVVGALCAAIGLTFLFRLTMTLRR